MGTVTYAGTARETYAYDADGHLTGVALASAVATADGSMTLSVSTTSLGSDVTRGSYTTDALGRLTDYGDMYNNR